MNVIEITAEKKPATEKIRLAAYCRVSSNSEDQLHSFAAQIRYYKDYERMHPEYRLVDGELIILYHLLFDFVA